ncbi:MAG: heme-binding protein [Candidatus Rokubacteria bacterium]|nr:heme-binding protein [Candidatus Rokubacteria bacterium]MBI4255555.1 heme-binding protein [Candidatus Rokubacteria bacterium]MBI4629281.1 heme-binding protein [Candidatus Rokubacteria bacterium]
MALTLRKAHECIERGFATAQALGFKVAIAVVDESGHLIACDRMDGALWITPEIARAKANASAAFRATTLELEERFNKGRLLFAGNVAQLGDYRLVFGKGAVPIVQNGRVVGAVGVSGAVPADNDHAIADDAAGHPGVPKSH